MYRVVNYLMLKETCNVRIIKSTSLLLTRLPKSKPSKIIIQTSLELWQDWGCDHFPGESVPGIKHPLSEKPFQMSTIEGLY